MLRKKEGNLDLNIYKNTDVNKFLGITSRKNILAEHYRDRDTKINSTVTAKCLLVGYLKERGMVKTTIDIVLLTIMFK